VFPEAFAANVLDADLILHILGKIGVAWDGEDLVKVRTISALFQCESARPHARGMAKWRNHEEQVEVCCHPDFYASKG